MPVFFIRDLHNPSFKDSFLSNPFTELNESLRIARFLSIPQERKGFGIDPKGRN